MPETEIQPRAEEVSVPAEFIERRIYLIRGQKVMVDSDLAELYGVLTKNLNLAVRRNSARFPGDFMFQLTTEESLHLDLNLRLQIATSTHGGRRYLPYVFTEQGVAMLSSVLKSDRAVLMNIAIMRAFVKLREVMTTHKDLARKIEDLERKYDAHDNEIQVIFDAIKQLVEPPPSKAKPRIGFHADSSAQ